MAKRKTWYVVALYPNSGIGGMMATGKNGPDHWFTDGQHRYPGLVCTELDWSSPMYLRVKRQPEADKHPATRYQLLHLPHSSIAVILEHDGGASAEADRAFGFAPAGR